MIEIVKLALNGGSFALLLLICIGAYKLADKWLPLLIGAINGNTSTLATLVTKIDGLGGQMTETRQRTSEIGADVRSITGEHAAVLPARYPQARAGSRP